MSVSEELKIQDGDTPNFCWSQEIFIEKLKMSRKIIATHLKNYLLHESDEWDDVVSDIKSSLSTAKGEFRDFLDRVMHGDEMNVSGVEKKVTPADLAVSLKTSKSGAALLKDVAFQARVGEIAENIGVQPTAIIRVMNKESRLNPKAVNKYTGASGLLQFMPSTAQSLGTSVEEIRNSPAIKQLDWVEKYFKPYRGKVHSYEDLYMVTFFPAALGKPKDRIIRTKKTSAELISRQNPVIARAAGKTPGTPLTIQDFYTYARQN
jgi:hypothetical protein